jgi:hypothetical protein
MSTALPPAGWYDNPDGNGVAYWDGRSWIDAQLPPGHSQVSKEEPQVGLITVGYVTAILMPLIGFILGIVTITRPNKATAKHGTWIIVASIAAFILYIVLIVALASSGTSSNSGYGY